LSGQLATKTDSEMTNCIGYSVWGGAWLNAVIHPLYTVLATGTRVPVPCVYYHAYSHTAVA